jgi:hypothetical protein
MAFLRQTLALTRYACGELSVSDARELLLLDVADLHPYLPSQEPLPPVFQAGSSLNSGHGKQSSSEFVPVAR